MLPTLSNRKATGAYYTPRPLIDLLLDHALCEGSRAPRRVLDPACGPGDFLVAAQGRLPAAEMFGVDLNASSVGACQNSIGLQSADCAGRDGASYFAYADALLDPPGFLEDNSFDLIVGNPPYVNAIEKYLNPAMKRRLRAKFPEVSGAADLAAYFFALAVRLIRPGGQIAFVLPRALLNSPTTQNLRDGLPHYLRPNLIYAPERNDLFPGAKIFIACLILGPGDTCLVSTDSEPATAKFERSTLPATHNWWKHLTEARSARLGVSEKKALVVLPLDAMERMASSPGSSPAFLPQSSLTTADAYDLLPHLVDSQDGRGQKLLTTGLIDPNISRWGQAACRFLNHTFRHPRVGPDAKLTPSLTRRLARSHRPKIILAGLCRAFEAYLDLAGEYLGSVATFSVFHVADDVGALKALVDHLHSAEVTRHFVATLAANALRGQYITIKKSFLLELVQGF